MVLFDVISVSTNNKILVPAPFRATGFDVASLPERFIPVRVHRSEKNGIEYVRINARYFFGVCSCIRLIKDVKDKCFFKKPKGDLGYIRPFWDCLVCKASCFFLFFMIAGFLLIFISETLFVLVVLE